MTKKFKFKASEGSFYSDKDAVVVGNFIKEKFLIEDNAEEIKKVSPKDLVKAATPKNSTIHKYFDWDDKSAASKHRLHTARQLISMVIIIVDKIPTRAFESVVLSNKVGRAYTNSKIAYNVPELSKQLLEKALSEIKFWQVRFKNLKELIPIFSAINKVLNKLEKETKNEKSKKSRKA